MNRNQNKRRAVVIGAGPGGLAAGMLLAGQGYKVDIYEKQAVIGGRSARLELGDYRFDRGATFLMMPHLLEEMFQKVNRSLYDYVDMQQLDPLYSLHFGDTVFKPSSDEEKTEAEIARVFPGDEQNYRNFMRDESVKYQKVEPLLRRPFGKLSDYIKQDAIKALPYLHLQDTVYGRLSRYFQDERLRWGFTFQAKYLGMSAWDCPGTFTILSYIEHHFGLHHPKGGVNQIFQAMADVIREYGGTIHTGTAVERIQVKQGRAQGILLKNGEEVKADHVVLNGDFAASMNKLFKPGVLKKYTPERIKNMKYSCSGAMLYLGVNKKIDLAHHSVHFASDYRKNVDEMTLHKTLSKDPSIYVHNPSVLDPTLAPEGKSSLYVLMPTPNTTADIDWDVQRAEIRQTMMDRLEQIPELAGLSECIEEEMFFTPLQWEKELDIYNGALFNLSHKLGQMMYLRPHNRFEEVEGVYLVGGGTHPGSGLPTIFESAKISVGLIQEDDARKQATRTFFKKGKEAGQWT